MSINNSKSHKIIILIFLLFVVLVVVMMLNNFKSQEPQVTVPVRPRPTQIPTSLRFALLTQGKPFAGKFFVGQPLKIQVLADSNNQDVVGFDLLVSYDKQAFEFLSVVSVNPAFQVFPNEKKDLNFLTAVTGIKKLASKEPTVFKDEPLAVLTFRPLKKGNYSFSLLPRYKKESTKLINNNVTVFNPKVERVNVEVQ